MPAIAVKLSYVAVALPPNDPWVSRASVHRNELFLIEISACGRQ